MPAGVVMFRERRVSLISLFYSTSHFPSCYQLYELETDNKLRGRRRPHISCLVLPTHLPSYFPGFLGSWSCPKLSDEPHFRIQRRRHFLPCYPLDESSGTQRQGCGAYSAVARYHQWHRKATMTKSMTTHHNRRVPSAPAPTPSHAPIVLTQPLIGRTSSIPTPL